jgi:hypothetical protein
MIIDGELDHLPESTLKGQEANEALEKKMLCRA